MSKPTANSQANLPGKKGVGNLEFILESFKLIKLSLGFYNIFHYLEKTTISAPRESVTLFFKRHTKAA